MYGRVGFVENYLFAYDIMIKRNVPGRHYLKKRPIKSHSIKTQVAIAMDRLELLSNTKFGHY